MTEAIFVVPAHPPSLATWQDLTSNERAWVEFIRVISGGGDPGIGVMSIRALHQALDEERTSCRTAERSGGS